MYMHFLICHEGVTFVIFVLQSRRPNRKEIACSSLQIKDISLKFSFKGLVFVFIPQIFFMSGNSTSGHDWEYSSEKTKFLSSGSSVRVDG